MELTNDLRTILDIGITLTSEKKYSRLLENIIMEAMKITNCDAGTLYILEPEGLRFMIMRTISMNIYKGGEGEIINLPPVALVEENICSYSALHHKIINIPDVYTSDEFDFKGPKKYDKLTGYRTESMLVLPLENHEGETLGVIQLMNAFDVAGKVVPFQKEHEYIVFSIASQAAVTMSNMRYMKDMNELLNSMVAAFTTAIDERSPYNANHSRNVAKYADTLIDFINQKHSKGETDLFFDENTKEQIVMAAYLHDIGKVVTPLEVMNKKTRLDTAMAGIDSRFELLQAWIKVDYLEGRMTREKYFDTIEFYLNALKLIEKANTALFLSDEILEELAPVMDAVYQRPDGSEVPLLTEQEKEALRIKKGTLTAEERNIMEEHVVITSKLLSEIYFGSRYAKVPMIAGAHHEYLNGTGYPNHLNEDTMPYEARILVVLDIFDSLISTDRPYKKSMPIDRALHILFEMVSEGKLDRNYVEMLNEYAKQELLDTKDDSSIR